MKKIYSKPIVEIETYTLSEAIAANCGDVVNLGPGDYHDVVCDGFDFNVDIVGYAMNASFYDGIDGDPCDCYYSAGGGYFTS